MPTPGPDSVTPAPGPGSPIPVEPVQEAEGESRNPVFWA